jgi:tetratricopeptide (TPR) repeat protein
MDSGSNLIEHASRSSFSRRWRAAVACGLLLAVASAFAQQANRDYYTARQTKEGAELLKNVEKYHIGSGIENMKNGNFAYAMRDFEFILRYFPNHPYALELVSELCDVKWKTPKCESDAWFRKAVDKNPTVAQTFLVNGLHLQRLNRVPDAIESYKRAIALNPASGNAHYNLALAYLGQKQYELANRHAQLSYALGMPFPGLRDQLTKAGQWKPMDPEELKRELAAPATASSTPSDTPSAQ